MSSNYPPGSMMGSGIFAENWNGEMFCSQCDKDVEVEGSTDDWHNTAFAECPDCGKDLEKDISYESEPDYDSEYDRQREDELDD